MCVIATVDEFVTFRSVAHVVGHRGFLHLDEGVGEEGVEPVAGVDEFLVETDCALEAAAMPVVQFHRRQVGGAGGTEILTPSGRTPTAEEEELAVFRRGRNAFTKNTPKNADTADYHAATGLEALFGYLYLSGDVERLRELFALSLHNSEME